MTTGKVNRLSISTLHLIIEYTHWKHSNGHMRKVRGCTMLSDWTILLIVLMENIFNKCMFSIIYSTDK